MNFGFVPPPIARWLWGQVEPLLLSALHTDDDIADVYADITTGHAQLWVARDTEVTGAAVTRKGQVEGREVVEIWLMGGQMADVPHILTIAEAAREVGAQALMLHGRKGWLRVLKPYGWKKIKEDDGLFVMEVLL